MAVHRRPESDPGVAGPAAHRAPCQLHGAPPEHLQRPGGSAHQRMAKVGLAGLVHTPGMRAPSLDLHAWRTLSMPSMGDSRGSRGCQGSQNMRMARKEMQRCTSAGSTASVWDPAGSCIVRILAGRPGSALLRHSVGRLGPGDSHCPCIWPAVVSDVQGLHDMCSLRAGTAESADWPAQLGLAPCCRGQCEANCRKQACIKVAASACPEHHTGSGQLPNRVQTEHANLCAHEKACHEWCMGAGWAGRKWCA